MTAPVATEQQADISETAESDFDTRGTLTVAGAHFAHDLYSAFLGPLIPAVQEKLAVPLFVASLMVPAQRLPSVVQPLIGAWADRTSKRWFVILSPGVAALSISAVGLAPNVALILLLLFVSGLAAAAFHAPAVALMGEYGGLRVGRAMSFFMFGGDASRAIGPLVITAAISWFTLEGSFVVLVFGVAASIILFFTIDTTASDQAAQQRRGNGVAVRPLLRARSRMITGLFGSSFMVVFYTAPFNYLLVAYLQDIGHTSWYSGLALSLFFGAGAIGGMAGGTLSDRLGRRNVIAGSLLLTAPILYLFLTFAETSVVALVFVVLGGIVGMANRPIQLALAQDLLPEARAQMSGFMLAFNFVVASLVTLGVSGLSDLIGLTTVMWGLPVFSLFALPFVYLLPRRGDELPMPNEG